MRFRLDRRKQAVVAAGLLAAVATATLGTSSARAHDFIGVDLGPVSIGVGANTPTYYAPPPSTYVAPSVTYSAPATVYEQPTTTTTSTYYWSAPGFVAVAPGPMIVR